jgi:hypothetical protein
MLDPVYIPLDFSHLYFTFLFLQKTHTNTAIDQHGCSPQQHYWEKGYYYFYIANHFR